MLNEAGEVILESKLPTTPKGIEEVFSTVSAQSDRTRNRDAFPLGQPAVDPVGTRSDRSPCAQRSVDRGEQPKR
jgi:hypothetical protein